MDVVIRRMIESDMDAIPLTFITWHKYRLQYERYFSEQQAGRRVVFVAVAAEQVVGYVTLVWETDYLPFRETGIPEIKDLNVAPEHQRQGIGTRLIAECEWLVSVQGKPIIGIGVGLTPDYGAAQRLYPYLGYISDGRGITDETRYFTKKLT